MSRSLTNNFSWMLLANTVYAACQWGMLIALAKLGDSVVVGQFTLGLAIATPVLTLTNMQLRSVQATDAKRQHSMRQYVGIRQITTAVGFLVIWLIALQTGYRHDTTSVILAVGVAKAIESMSDVIYGLFQQREQLDLIAKSMMIRGIISVVVLSSVIFATSNLVLAILSMAAGWMAQLLLYDARQAHRILRSQGEPNRWLLLPWPAKPEFRLVQIAWPLGVVSMLISLNMNMPRYFIQHYMGERELGVFAALAYLSLTIITVADSLGHSASPRLAMLYASRRQSDYRRLVKQLGGVGVLMAIGSSGVAVLVGKPLLSLAYRPEYAAYSGVLTELMVATGIACIASLLTYGITAARRFTVQIMIFGSAACAAATAAAIFVPRYGLYGAAHAVVAGSLFHLAAAVLALYRDFIGVERQPEPAVAAERQSRASIA